MTPRPDPAQRGAPSSQEGPLGRTGVGRGLYSASREWLCKAVDCDIPGVVTTNIPHLFRRINYTAISGEGPIADRPEESQTGLCVLASEAKGIFQSSGTARMDRMRKVEAESCSASLERLCEPVAVREGLSC
ncbi:hypothetical protein PYW07_008818 [Mythimna separata]|uniref:Uncharacterized protein n=1 Tax=Mythimna separata TaxID=271217 RepID=A0AAD7YAI6_MYTSE|nr:hypothetical protein PYW07_008818 [Mythimna separata]